MIHAPLTTDAQEVDAAAPRSLAAMANYAPQIFAMVLLVSVTGSMFQIRALSMILCA